jgi:lipopolysaccharide export system permease protein
MGADFLKPRMRLIDRYVLNEFWPLFGLAYGVATFIFFLDKLFRIASLALNYHLDMFTVVQLFAYLLPTVSGLTLPIAFLVGCTLTFNRLSTDSEIVALKASGIGFYRLLLPLFPVAFLVYALSSAMLMYGSPWGFQGVKHLFLDVARTRVLYELRPGEFLDAFAGLSVYIERTDPQARRLEGVFIAETRVQPQQVITAKEGELLASADGLQILLRLTDGRLHRYDPEQKRYHLLRFEHYDVQLSLYTELARWLNRPAKPREFFPAQLQAEIDTRQAKGEDVSKLILFRHKQFTLPFACLLFAGLGPSIGMVRTRSGRSSGYIVGVGVIFVYYLFLTASDVVAQDLGAPLLLASWFPNLVMCAVTLWLVRRTAR